LLSAIVIQKPYIPANRESFIFPIGIFSRGDLNRGMSTIRGIIVGITVFLAFATRAADESGFARLFPEDGIPNHWSVRAWNDVKNPGPDGAVWKVVEGVLHGSEPRGTWLVSDKEYGDFVLRFEFKLGERGNSGCGLRFPGFGDPAFDGLELQMVDPRYYPPDFGDVPANELTGSLYRAIAPSEQLFQPTAWNRYEVTCRGANVKVVLNGRQVVDDDLSKHHKIIKRHNGADAVPLKDRPRKGHIGFQELSRGGAHVEIRNAEIKELGTIGAVIQPNADGTVLLHAKDAAIHGSTVRYEPEPHKNTIGYWTKKDDWVSWDFAISKPGSYKVEALQGCGPGSGGSEVIFRVGEQQLKMKVRETKHFQDFIPRDIGTVIFKEPGEYQLKVQPETKPGVAVMDLRQVRLIPIP
jgi:hypothetical protein